MEAIDPIILGKFGKPFGVWGWIKVISFTIPKAKILNFLPWIVKVDNQKVELLLEDSKTSDKNIVVKLPSYNSPEQVKALTNSTIEVKRQQLPQLPDHEYYWFELIGLEVINRQDIKLGKVEKLIATGANDVLVVSQEQHKRLIPYISTVILDVDLTKKVIQVDWEKDFLI